MENVFEPTSYFGVSGELRALVTDSLLKPVINPVFVLPIRNGQLLCKPQHFSVGVWRTLQLRPKSRIVDNDLFRKIVLAGLKLEQYRFDS